jgi:hypothetical protein
MRINAAEREHQSHRTGSGRMQVPTEVRDSLLGEAAGKGLFTTVAIGGDHKVILSFSRLPLFISEYPCTTNLG